MMKQIIPPEQLVATARQWVADGYCYPVVHTAVDYEEWLELIYILRHQEDPRREDRIASVRLESANLCIASLTPWIPGLNFQEREVYDLFGVIYIGHPDLRRLLLPEGFQGHPLRKHYTQVDGDIL
ncbi:MAG: NADH-quinone oxidoreductase subunit C [Sulfobacillus thermosulfidooxidans]|uniref:NADH-quinone oxidoreductase n=1 Tax=Sulfobacillus thermosulfidooxidans TaxID=28034 RepID=A0A2T2WTR0_SULTH|nr:MAG: NADH-quinone oxidoreductase subunit C [Sulfobacillus thermosulfidooxidans]